MRAPLIVLMLTAGSLIAHPARAATLDNLPLAADGAELPISPQLEQPEPGATNIERFIYVDCSDRCDYEPAQETGEPQTVAPLVADDTIGISRDIGMFSLFRANASWVLADIGLKSL